MGENMQDRGPQRINGIMAESEFIRSLMRDNSAEANPGDYIGANDLLYCGKCNTAKQTRVMFFGHKVVCACQCEDREYTRIRKAQEDSAKADRLRARRVELQDAGLEIIGTDRYLFENDDGSAPELMRIAHNYVANFDSALKKGLGLIFCGDLGTGKTFAACCIGNELFPRNYDVVISSFRAIADASWRSKKLDYPAARSRALQCDLLILDDFGTERCTDYMIQEMFDIIDVREKNQKPIIVTTNLSPRQIQQGENINIKRIADRMFSMCHLVLAKGESNRRMPMKDPDKQELLRKIGLI